MLDLAFKYEKEIREKMMNTWYDEKYMFYYATQYHSIWENPKSEDGDWFNRKFVSLNSNGEILGLIDYHVDHECDMAIWFGAINFSDNKIVFGMDLVQVIDDIFCKFNMRKMEFNVIVGNPIEKNYDKLIKKYGGRIVGIRKQHSKLLDNKYYDDKLYELFREDYIKAKENMKHECNRL